MVQSRTITLNYCDHWKIKIICMHRNIIHELDVDIMFSNEVIEMNVVVFDYFRNTVVSTAIITQHARQLRRSAYIESCINLST